MISTEQIRHIARRVVGDVRAGIRILKCSLEVAQQRGVDTLTEDLIEQGIDRPPPRRRGDDDLWPTDYRDVLQLVLDEIEDRIAVLWDE